MRAVSSASRRFALRTDTGKDRTPAGAPNAAAGAGATTSAAVNSICTTDAAADAGMPTSPGAADAAVNAATTTTVRTTTRETDICTPGEDRSTPAVDAERLGEPGGDSAPRVR